MNKSLVILKNAKQVSLSEAMLLNVWLEEFYNTTIEEVSGLKEFIDVEDSQKFYSKYKVTQVQYEWWEGVVKEALVKKMGSKVANKFFMWNSLNTAPMVGLVIPKEVPSKGIATINTTTMELVETLEVTMPPS